MTNALLALLLSLGILTTRDVVRDMSTAAGVDPQLAACIVTWESSWVVDEVSTSGAVGLWQIKPETAKWAAGKLGMETYDLVNPVDNTALALYILQEYPTWFLVYEWCI